MCTAMRITLRVLTMVLIVTAVSTHAAEKKQGSTSKYKAVGIVRSKDVPATVSDRIVSHVKANAPLKARAVSKPVSGGEIEGKTHVANARTNAKESLPLLVLVGKVARRPERVIISAKDSVALINVGAFQEYLKQPDKISDECLKRIDRAAMKAVGALFGLPACQNPFCAMSDVESKPHIPVQGRNYCPACLPEFEEMLGLSPIAKDKTTGNKKKAE